MGVPDPTEKGEIWGPKRAIANCRCHLANGNEERYQLFPNYVGLVVMAECQPYVSVGNKYVFLFYF